MSLVCIYVSLNGNNGYGCLEMRGDFPDHMEVVDTCWIADNDNNRLCRQNFPQGDCQVIIEPFRSVCDICASCA